MKLRVILFGIGWLAVGLWAPMPGLAAAERPNFVYLLADDLGYGDVKAFNPNGKIPTPNLDRVAAEGMRFTDAHSSSSVCTPTRYSILTGRYNWRSRLGQGVLSGYSRPLIEPGRLTLAAYLHGLGYTTAAMGKWHLGFDWPLREGGWARDAEDGWKVDYSKPIAHGPIALGFDQFFGIAASLDMPPYVFIENDRATEIPTREKKWIRSGPAGAQFEAEQVLPALTGRAVEYLEERSRHRGKPFFLYLALTAPHTPILPDAQWKGASGINAYADFVMQVDATVGRFLDALDRTGLASNTVLVVTSDNGCSPAADFKELARHGHNPSFHFRGEKADIFDGGHRIPFMVRWPGRIRPGTSSDSLVCLTDWFSTCADILGETLPESAAEDSISLAPLLFERKEGARRDAIVHHSINGSFSIRRGRWKLELCSDSGGWSAPRPGSAESKRLPAVQLYDLDADIGEETNVVEAHPEVVRELVRLLEEYVRSGRSTPGPPQKNTREVNIWEFADRAAVMDSAVPGSRLQR